MEKPKIIIVGINNDKHACIEAIKAVESLGFETLVIDPKTRLETPKETILKLTRGLDKYNAKDIYSPPKSKYHN